MKLIVAGGLVVAFGLTGCATSSAIGSANVQVDPDGVSVRIMRDSRIGGRRVAILAEDLFYCYPPTRELIVVPKGYVTDFASVPVIADHFVDRYGDNIEAAIVHDWLYAVGETGRRPWADQVFRFALWEQGVGVFERFLAHESVRIGGESAYGNQSEWNKRFFDQRTNRIRPAPFKRPKSAVVARIGSCDSLNNRSILATFKTRYGSATWPPSSRPWR